MKKLQVILSDVDIFYINEIRKMSGEKYGFSIVGVIRSSLEFLYRSLIFEEIKK